MSKVCKRRHYAKRNRWGACVVCMKILRRRYRKKRRAAERILNASKKRDPRGYWITDKGRRALAASARRPIVVSDHSPQCGCGDCVMARLRRRGKLATG